MQSKLRGAPAIRHQPEALSNDEFWHWYRAAARGQQPSLKFISRRLRRTRAVEFTMFYVPAISRLLEVTRLSLLGNFGEDSFAIKPANLLGDYRKRPARADTYFLDRVVYVPRLAEFKREKIPAVEEVRMALEMRNMAYASKRRDDDRAVALDVYVWPEEIPKLQALCERREFIFPARWRDIRLPAEPSNSALAPR